MKKITVIGIVLVVVVVVYMTWEQRSPNVESSITDLHDGTPLPPRPVHVIDQVTGLNPTNALSDAHRQVPSAETKTHLPDGFSIVSTVPMTKGQMTSGRSEIPEKPLPDWLTSASSINAILAQASKAGRDWTYGWVAVADGVAASELVDRLSRLGITMLASDGRLRRSILPADASRLSDALALSAIHGIGVLPADRKLHDALSDAAHVNSNAHATVFVSFMADDTDGSARQRLEELGAEVLTYYGSLFAVSARVPVAYLSDIANLDLVQLIEPVKLVEAAHDTAVPVLGVDGLRHLDPATGSWLGFGGSSVAIGVADTGLNTRHIDIKGEDRNICAVNFVPTEQGLEANDDLYIDEGAHGTHVTGTIVGAGLGEARFVGMAPGVRDVRFAKVLSKYGGGADSTILPGLEYLATESSCDDSSTPRVAKPAIVNMSFGACSTHWVGRTLGERHVDAIVWGARQLLLAANANARDICFSDYASAKNVMGIGAIQDDGEIAQFSSHGPTNDNRLAPLVSATGVAVYSAKGGGSRSGYVAFSGTSMATPSVAGVAALLMDAVPSHKFEPALARARLMASAIRPDSWMDEPTAFPRNNSSGPGAINNIFGLGKVSASTSIVQTDTPSGWVGGSAYASLNDDEYGYVDIEVPVGASRLDLVMTWDEPPVDAISEPVINNLDLWLDLGANCGSAACGEYVSRSTHDNVEWLIVDDPPAGTWRAKVTAPRVYTSPPRAALSWTVIRGASTPQLGVSASVRSRQTDRTRLEIDVSSDMYVASSVQLEVSCRASTDSRACEDLELTSAKTRRLDGVITELSEEIRSSFVDNLAPRITFPVGEVWVGNSRRFELTLTHQELEPLQLAITASAWNAKATYATVALVDEAEPPFPGAPRNDEFEEATLIHTAKGRMEIDMFLATPDPGEPVYGGTTYESGSRPTGSIWYRWTPAADGLANFRLEGVEQTDSHRVEVFRGQNLAALDRIGPGGVTSQVLAKVGEDYYVRVSTAASGKAIALRWEPGTRPINDDFASAATLVGITGDFEGIGTGATLEQGEWFGGVASTTWHRWTAPKSHWFQFELDGDGLIAVFEGSSLSSLRLVSGFYYRSSNERFLAEEGRTYYVMVGGEHAYDNGGMYRIHWDESADESYDNDLIKTAATMTNEESGRTDLYVQNQHTVSPGEPRETGVRTTWSRWNAPENGRYTFMLTQHQFAQVALFLDLETAADSDSERVPTFEELTFQGHLGGYTGKHDLSLEVTDDRAVYVVAGMPLVGDVAYAGHEPQPVLHWGPTPVNDSVDTALEISGLSGSIDATTQFATSTAIERVDQLGRSTVWWKYQTDEASWIQVDVNGEGGPFSITVLHRKSGDDTFEVLRSSRWRELGPTLLFEAQPGVEYRFVVGLYGDADGGDFTLSWDAKSAPAWLRFAGQLEDGQSDATGELVELWPPTAVATNESSLFVSSREGVQVFEIDPLTGGLSWRQNHELDLPIGPIVWDADRDRLILQKTACHEWYVLNRAEDKVRLEDAESLMSDASDLTCFSTDTLLLQPGGNEMYRLGQGRIEVLEFGEGATVTHHQSIHESVTQGAISADGDFLYTIGYGELLTFQRNSTSNTFDVVDRFSELDAYQAIAIDVDKLMVVTGLPYSAAPLNVVFSLATPEKPEEELREGRFWQTPSSFQRRSERECKWVGWRLGGDAVDVVCDEVSYALSVDASNSRLNGDDVIASWQVDRFDALIPEYTHALAAAESNDRAFVYIATEAHGIMIFERLGIGR